MADNSNSDPLPVAYSDPTLPVAPAPSPDPPIPPADMAKGGAASFGEGILGPAAGIGDLLRAYGNWANPPSGNETIGIEDILGLTGARRAMPTLEQWATKGGDLAHYAGQAGGLVANPMMRGGRMLAAEFVPLLEQILANPQNAGTAAVAVGQQAAQLATIEQLRQWIAAAMKEMGYGDGGRQPGNPPEGGGSDQPATR
jgi:hypothetical protein